MAQQQNFGAISWMIPVILMTTLFLSGCVGRPETEVKVVTQVQKLQIPTVARPKPLQLTDTRVRVVNADNLDEFLREYEEQYGNIAFVALSMRDYENLALNIADIRRFLQQQEQIIIYYEKALTDEETPPKEEDNSNGVNFLK